MIDYQIIHQPEDKFRREFAFAYVWLEPRVVIDARYLKVNTSRDNLLYNMRLLTYKIMALNDNIGKSLSQEAVCAFISSKIHRAVKDYGIRVSVFYEDIKDVVEDCFATEPPRDMNIMTNSKLEWKSNVKELLNLTMQEEKESCKLGDKDKAYYLANIKSKKKMLYANSVMSEATQTDIILKIESAIEAIKSVEHNGRITRTDISEFSGVTYSTVCKYIDIIPQLKDVEVVDSRTESSIKVNELLEEGCFKIHDGKDRITKMRLHKESSVSRPTIDKKCKGGALRLQPLINNLNNKL